jgi:hypothetical protein
MDCAEYDGWRAWFKADKPGGARTPEMELMDAFAARAAAAYFNVHRKEDMAAMDVRDFLEYPPQLTPEQEDAEYEARVVALGNKVDAIYTRHNARVMQENGS